MLHSNLFAGIERHFGAFVKTYKRDYARLSIGRRNRHHFATDMIRGLR
jgi:hypothetical protein